MKNILLVDIGGTHVRFGFSIDGKPHNTARLFTTSDLRRRDPVEALTAMARTVIQETQITPDLILSTVPGFINTDEDRILCACNIPELTTRRLASEWSASIGIPVILERDSVLTLIGESVAGAAKGAAKIERESTFAQIGRPMDIRWASLGWASVLYAAPHSVREHIRRHPKGIEALQARIHSSIS